MEHYNLKTYQTKYELIRIFRPEAIDEIINDIRKSETYKNVIKNLSDMDKAILRLRIEYCMTLDEIGKELRVSREDIRLKVKNLNNRLEAQLKLEINPKNFDAFVKILPPRIQRYINKNNIKSAEELADQPYEKLLFYPNVGKYGIDKLNQSFKKHFNNEIVNKTKYTVHTLEGYKAIAKRKVKL